VDDPLSKRRLKAWVRLLGVTRRTERELREFLRTGHDTTLPRFDVLAALWRRREGVTMSELSRMLLVSNGNATAVVDRLEADGLVRRSPSGHDRRTVHVALTEAGLARFEGLAAEHERAVSRAFAGLSGEDLDRLTEILKRIAPKEAP
jgi:DNA-binding MarR family transcriptional regulator